VSHLGVVTLVADDDAGEDVGSGDEVGDEDVGSTSGDEDDRLEAVGRGRDDVLLDDEDDEDDEWHQIYLGQNFAELGAVELAELDSDSEIDLGNYVDEEL
jgi:hypothetical protein